MSCPLLYLCPNSLGNMENPKATISEAFLRFKESISEADAYDFSSTELKDVWQVVRDIDGAQRQRQSAQNLRRILEKYAKVVEVLCNGTPYLPYVWVFPLQLLQNDISDTLSRFR